jgi:hypothetical protein
MATYSTKQNLDSRDSLRSNHGAGLKIKDNRAESAIQRKLQDMANLDSRGQKKNETGLPGSLQHGIESISGVAMSDVNVHYNSNKPAQLQALAFAQGTDIHVAPGQETHLPHEAWHVVQQKQGRVKPTKQLGGATQINDDESLETEADVMGVKANNWISPDVSQLKADRPHTSLVYQLEDGADALKDDADNSVPETNEVSQEEDATPEEVAGIKELQEAGVLKAPEEGSTSDETDAVATESGLALSPSLNKKDKSFLNKHGDRIVTNVTKGSEYASGVGTAADTLVKAQDPAVQGSTIMEKTQKLFETSASKVDFFGILSKISGLGSPLKSAIENILAAKSKLDQWRVFEDVVMDKTTKEKKADAPAEAVYGLGKIWKGFVRTIKNVIMAVSTFTANLLMLIPGAQIVAGPWKAFNMVVGAIDSAFKGGKRFYQWIKGEKKVENASSVFSKAVNKDDKALDLIYNLKLSSITGSSFSLVNSLGKNVQAAKSFIKMKLGWDESEAVRIIDMSQKGGPSSKEELAKHLLVVNESKESKQLVLDDLKEAMTGFGT